MEPVYRPVTGFALGVLKTMKWKVLVTGEEHIPERGGAIIATNHVGYLDFVFVGFAARERGRLVRFQAKKEVFDHRIAGPLMRGMKHLSVDRFGTAAEAVRVGADAVRAGEIVGTFPEGTISRSFVPRAGKTGAARMAMEGGVPLIPGCVWGTQRILTKDRPKNFQRDLVITVDFAPPISYEPEEDPRKVTDRLMGSITDLWEVAVDRYPQAPAGDDERWWLPASAGGSAPTVVKADEMAARDRAARRARREKRQD